MKSFRIFVLVAGFIALAVSGAYAGSVVVMSFNMRYDNPGDGRNGWPHRRDAAAGAIAGGDVDIAGTQELLHNQLVDLGERLPEYSRVGVGREDGDMKGEYCAIFYKTSRFEALESGTFWLSEDPGAVGLKGWDAACERVATWAVLRERYSGEELLVVNTHLDHVGEVARRESTTLLRTKITELSGGRPVVLTGDFNAGPDSGVIERITEGGVLLDSRMCAETITDDAPGTFHEFGKIETRHRERIDYIFVTPDVRVSRYRVVPEQAGGVYLSDHNPVVAEIVMPAQPPQLCFGEDGRFRIVQFSDIHLDVTKPEAEESARVIREVVGREKPQLIVITGDVVTYAPADKGWEFIAALFGDLGIPWCVTMGNHDGESPVPGISKKEIFDYLRGKPGYIGSAGASVKGTGNFVIEVLGSRSGRVEALLYCVDSNDYPADPKFGKYDLIGFDQIAWYRDTGERYRRQNGGEPVPSLMFFHVPLLEASLAASMCTIVGTQRERIPQGGINSGLFASMLEQGDVMGTFSGHDHDNDYAGIYRGILLSYCRVGGTNAYGGLERGGRVISLCEGRRSFDTWIATPRGTEHLYYYPSGISRADEESMKYLPAVEAAPASAGVEYRYYEGGGIKRTRHIATKGKLKAEGVIPNFSLSPALAGDHFGMEFNALVEIPERGVYRFHTVSDDGSRLWVDGRLVVDNDGSHDARKMGGMVALERGYHRIRVLYFDDYMGESLEVGLAGRNMKEASIPDEMLFIENGKR